MPVGQSFPERLRSLRQGGAEALAPLWIEQLSAEEALAELRGRDAPLFRLQEARFLLHLNRHDEARTALGSLGPLPRGLASLREELMATVGLSVASPAEAASSPETSEPLASQERTSRMSLPKEERISCGEALEAWLSCVQGWKRVLGV